MISSKDNFRYQQTASNIFSDGTFIYSLKFFFQLYAIHDHEYSMYTSCAFFILPDKKGRIYYCMFSYLKAVCQELEIVLLFAAIHFDLEVVVHCAVKATWIHITIKACTFHVAQSYYRHIQKVGLTQEYKCAESDGKWLFKIFFSLHLLYHLQRLKTVFVLCFLLMLQNIKNQVFAGYMLPPYVTRSAVFPSHHWTHSGEDSRTTNAFASFHRYLGSTLSVQDPTSSFLWTLFK